MAEAALELPAVPRVRRRELVFGSAFATSGVAMLLLTLIGAYLAARNAGGDTWLASNAIPLTQANVQLFGLAMSVVTMQWALYSAEHDDRTNTLLALLVTLVLGVAFVNQTTFLFKMAGVTAEQPEGTLFYAVTGGHLAMAVVAIAMLVLVGFRALAGSYSSRNPDGVAALAVFWDAMVAIYAVIWVGVYIMK